MTVERVIFHEYWYSILSLGISFFDFVILKRIITFNALKDIKDKVRYKIFASKPIQEIEKTV